MTPKEKRERNIQGLRMKIITTSSIECSFCYETDEGWLDEYEFAQEMHHEGWRKIIKNNHGIVYCPKCAKKNKITLDMC